MKSNLKTDNAMATYRDLLNLLQSMSDEQLNCTPTIHDPNSDEYFSATNLLMSNIADCVLDENHPYFSVELPQYDHKCRYCGC